MEDVERLISREALRELSGRWKGLEWVGRKIKMIFWRLPLMVFSGCCVSAFYAHIGLMSILFGGLLDPTSSQREWRLWRITNCLPIRVYDASVLSVVNAHARERHVPVRLHFLVPSVAVQGDETGAADGAADGILSSCPFHDCCPSQF